MFTRFARHPKAKHWFSKVGYVPADAEISLGHSIERFNKVLDTRTVKPSSDRYSEDVSKIIVAEVSPMHQPKEGGTTKLIVALLGFLGTGTAGLLVSSFIGDREVRRDDKFFDTFKREAARVEREKDREITELKEKLARPWYKR